MDLKWRKTVVHELCSDSSGSRVSHFPPARVYRIESYDMLAVCLAALQLQGWIVLEKAVFFKGPSAEDLAFDGSKLRQAFTASSCCFHACSELRRGIFERACRISSADLHEPFMGE